MTREWIGWPEHGSVQGWHVNTAGANRGYGATMADLANLAGGMSNAIAPRNKLKDAIAYLRSSGKYCLDQKQPRITPTAQPETILDRWLKERRK